MILAVLLATVCGQAIDPKSPEARAVAYVVQEVPAWSRENRCFSCHNNGDAARALIVASRIDGFKVPDGSLADTLRYLSQPDRWSDASDDSPVKDEKLGRLQFASALATSLDTGRTTDRAPLDRAAALVARDQSDDGSWPIEAGNTLGSPATYGRALATARAVQTLRLANSGRFEKAIARGETWLRNLKPRNVPEAAALLMTFPADPTAQDFLRTAQNDDGGWGPFPRTPPEPFDTALALLALAKIEHMEEAIKRGRQALIALQTTDGSWPETTRPRGGESYAQRLSTTGWATLALLATRKISP